MRITTRQLRNIIREEASRALNEARASTTDVHLAYAAAMKGLEKIDTLVARLATRPDLDGDYRVLGPIKDQLSAALRDFEARLPQKRPMVIKTRI